MASNKKRFYIPDDECGLAGKLKTNIRLVDCTLGSIRSTDYNSKSYIDSIWKEYLVNQRTLIQNHLKNPIIDSAISGNLSVYRQLGDIIRDGQELSGIDLKIWTDILGSDINQSLEPSILPSAISLLAAGGLIYLGGIAINPAIWGLGFFTIPSFIVFACHHSRNYEHYKNIHRNLARILDKTIENVCDESSYSMRDKLLNRFIISIDD